MSKVEWPANCTYFGADIVPELIRKHNGEISSNHIRFFVADVVCDKLPATEVLFCRDCFIHLSNDQIKNAVCNIRGSKAEFYILTTYPNILVNRDIRPGCYRPINLQIDPFCFPPPIEIVKDSPHEGAEGKCMGIWTELQLASVIERWDQQRGDSSP